MQGGDGSGVMSLYLDSNFSHREFALYCGICILLKLCTAYKVKKEILKCMKLYSRVRGDADTCADSYEADDESYWVFILISFVIEISP